VEVKGRPLPAPVFGRQEMLFRRPTPFGVEVGIQLEPPSVVMSTTPATWSTSMELSAAIQQSRSPVHEMLLALEIPADSVPTCTHPACSDDETNAVVPAAVLPVAMHQWSDRHETAVTSRIPAGTASDVQVVPPSDVTMISPAPLDVWLAWPTAAQCRLSLHEMPDRYPTVAGTASVLHETPPLVVEMIAAPFGAPATPSVDPTAQHRRAVAQSTSSSALTGVGGVTEAKAPSHGDPGAMVEGAAEPPVADVQPPATTATGRTSRHHRMRWVRPGTGVRELAGALPSRGDRVTGP